MLSLGLEDELRRAGLTEEAKHIAAGTRQVWKGKPDLIYEAACKWAVSISLIAGNTSDDVAQKERYNRLCLDAIREAATNGYRDHDRFLTDHRLAPIRATKGFQDLIRALKVRTPPFEGVARGSSSEQIGTTGRSGGVRKAP